MALFNTRNPIEYPVALLELLGTAFTGAGAMAAGLPMGLLNQLKSGEFGDNTKAFDKTQKDVMEQYTFQPRTQTAQDAIGLISNLTDEYKIPPLVPELLPLMSLSANPTAISAQTQQLAKSAGQSLAPKLGQMAENYMFKTGMAQPIVPVQNAGLLKTINKAPVSDIGFYSAAEQAGLNLQRNQGTGQAFINDLMKAPDVKKDELMTMGLLENFGNKASVTKAELQDYLANNRIDVKEVRLGESISDDPIGMAKRKAVFDKYQPEIDSVEKQFLQYTNSVDDKINAARNKLADAHVKLNTQGYMPTAQDYEAYALAEANLNRIRSLPREFNPVDLLRSSRDAEANAAYVIPEPRPTKHENYQLPGGENYRELLLTLPNQWDKPKAMQTANSTRIKELRDQMRGTSGTNEIRSEISKLQNENTALQQQISEAPLYQSSHFNEPNILAHMRVNDRIDADGKKMMLIEEIQSDWHQVGREKGYQRKDLTVDQIDLKYIPPNVPEGQNPANYPGYYEAFDKNTGAFVGRHSGSLSQEQAMRDAVSSANQFKTGVPDAPFKDTWYQLALKRAVKEAVDKGYDRVGITTGKQQADRYKLSNEVDEINVIGRTNPLTGEKSRQVALDLKSGGSYKLGVNNEGIIDNVNMLEINNLQGKKLADVVGKEVAKKIMESNSQTIKGEGLNIGGEGMKKYYDEIYPKYLDKFAKKHGSKISETSINTNARAQTKDQLAKAVYGHNETYKNLPSEQKRKVDVMFMDMAKEEKIRYIDITPSMKEAVSKGQPLASATPMGGLLGQDIFQA